LAGFLENKASPASADEGIAFAELCAIKNLNHAAVRFYEGAFLAKRGLADDPGTGHRYNAACNATLAGCGMGHDAGKLDGAERARLRRLALDWLRADLDEWDRRLTKEPAKTCTTVRKQMQRWQVDTDLVDVRGAQAIAKLPEMERQPWQKLWDDVASLQARAQAETTPEKRPGAK
jgi:hypothetical protein